MITELLNLIDRYPDQSSLILILGYVLGIICNFFFMRIATTITKKHE